MEFNYFVEEIRREVEQRCGSVCEAKIQQVRKNNGKVCTGMAFSRKEKQETSVSPIVYLEPYYESCEDGSMTVSGAADMIFETAADYMEYEDVMVLTEDFIDFRRIRGRICYELIHYERNRELLEEVVYLPYCDLAVVFYVLAESRGESCVRVMIRKEHLKLWKTDVETLYALAKRNTPALLPAWLASIDGLMRTAAEARRKAGVREGMPDRETEEEPEMIPLYILTNYKCMNGAAAILYDGVLRKTAEQFGTDLVILPSSIHEVLLLPYEEGLDAAQLERIVSTVNRTEVRAEEVLSDRVYIYNRKTDSVVIMSDKTATIGEAS